MLEEKTRQQIALFRYGLIADLVHRRERERGLYVLLREKAARSYEIPGSRRTRVAVETLRDWLGAYRRGGFEALYPKPRRDQGRARAIPQEVADLLCSIKEERPALSVALVIEQAKSSGSISESLYLAPATVHRLLSRSGLMDKKPTEPTSKDRRRFAFEKANELWMSDVMHGPAVIAENKRKRKTYLIAFLDDATRVVPYATFAFSENTAAFMPALQQAIRRRGVPQRLYVDNGAAYRSHHLALVCAKVGITLIHARPYQPQGKGKQERWFRTVRMQLLSRLHEDDTKSLEALNRKLWSWVEAEYHQTPHRGLDGVTPFDRWAMSADDVRLADSAVIEDLFFFEQIRKVQKDRTVSLLGLVYEVDASLVGQTVTLRFDPSRKGRPIDVYFNGRKIQQAKPVDLYANCFVRRDHTTKHLNPDSPPPSPPQGLPLRKLKPSEEN
ncbi:MAG: DDE-type integrase/transposase/recombinase [Vicinamibacteria bacterium]